MCVYVCVSSLPCQCICVTDLVFERVLRILHVLELLQQFVLLRLAATPLFGEIHGDISPRPLMTQVTQLLAGVRVTAGRLGRGGGLHRPVQPITTVGPL